MNMAMICGLVNPFITNNNVTARGARSPGSSRARGAEKGTVGRGGIGGAYSRLEIHLQYRPRLFSCLITPCQLKLNNKIYAAQSAPPTSLTSTSLFRAFGIRCRFLRLPAGRRLLDGWLSRDFHYYDSEILLGATRSLRRYTTRCSRVPRCLPPKNIK